MKLIYIKKKISFKIICVQGEKELTSLPRFKSWTDGVRGLVFLGVENAQRSDEGVYRWVCCQNTKKINRTERYSTTIFVKKK